VVCELADVDEGSAAVAVDQHPTLLDIVLLLVLVGVFAVHADVGLPAVVLQHFDFVLLF
jgi:hypothetical protein